MKKQTFKFLALAISLLTFLGNTEVGADELKLTVPLGKIIESDVPSVCGGFGPYPRDIVDMAREILTNFEYEIFTPEAYGDELIYFATGVNENGLNKIDLSMKYLARIAEIPVAKREDKPNAPIVHFIVITAANQREYSENKIIRSHLTVTMEQAGLSNDEISKELDNDLEKLNKGAAISELMNFRDPFYRKYIFRVNPDVNKRQILKYLGLS